MGRERMKVLGRSRIGRSNRITLPRRLCERLDLQPGDMIRYMIDGDVVTLDKAPPAYGDFSVFSEWASPADEAAYADL